MKLNWKRLRKNLPNKIRVAPRSFYEVLWIEGFHSDKYDEKTFGETRFDKNQIVLNTDQPPKEAVLTYFHEFLHAVSNEVEANLTESQVRALETAFPAFRDLILALEGEKK